MCKTLNRRLFLTGSGALVFGFMFPVQGNAEEQQQQNASSQTGDRWQTHWFQNAFIKIDVHNHVTFLLPNIEIGQGIHTAASMMLAEELEVGFASVSTETFISDLDKNHDFAVQEDFFITYGSGSTAKDWIPLRQAAASLRMMFIQAAAEKFKAVIERCYARNGFVFGPDNHSLPYGALISDIIHLNIPLEVQYKKKTDYQIIGKSHNRMDTELKITGHAVYGMDIRLSNMKTGYMVLSSVKEDQIIDCDDRQTRQVKGVLDVLKRPDGICIVADHYWAASQGAKQLLIQWKGEKESNFTTSFLDQSLKEGLKQTSTILYHNSNQPVVDSLKSLKHQYHWNYQQPMLLHAAIEPISCTVFFHDDQCELWLGSQAPLTVKEQIAQQYSIDKNKIIVHHNVIGGSFGRRLAQDYILQAVHFAKQVAYPLKCIWSREADFQCDSLRSPYYDQVRIGVDSNNKVKAIHHRMMTFVDCKDKNNPINPDYLLGLDSMPYQIENYQFEYTVCEMPCLNFGTGQGREATRNIFVLESLMNRLAFHAQQDPIEYRKALIVDPRAMAVLDLLMQQVAWGKDKSKTIRQGFAMAHVSGSYIAMVIEAELTMTSVIQLHRVDVAVDCGIIVNPDQVIAQVESAVVFGLSDALYGEVQIEKGQVLQRNYNQYRVLRMDDAPVIHVYLASNDEAPSAVGELGTVVAAPALAHALGLIQGKFYESLPLAKQIVQHS